MPVLSSNFSTPAAPVQEGLFQISQHALFGLHLWLIELWIAFQHSTARTHLVNTWSIRLDHRRKVDCWCCRHHYKQFLLCPTDTETGAFLPIDDPHNQDYPQYSYRRDRAFPFSSWGGQPWEAVLGRFHLDKRQQLFVVILSAMLREQVCFWLWRPVWGGIEMRGDAVPELCCKSELNSGVLEYQWSASYHHMMDPRQGPQKSKIRWWTPRLNYLRFVRFLKTSGWHWVRFWATVGLLSQSSNKNKK